MNKHGLLGISLFITVPAGFLPFLFLRAIMDGWERAHERFSWSTPWESNNLVRFYGISGGVLIVTSTCVLLMWLFANRLLRGELGLTVTGWRLLIVLGLAAGVSFGAWVAFF